MLSVLWCAWIVSAPSQGTVPIKVWLNAAESFKPRLQEGIALEQPSVLFVDEGEQASVLVSLRELDSNLVLSINNSDERVVGPASESLATIRVAILLITGHLENERARRTRQPTPESVGLVSAEDAGAWRIEVAADLAAWTFRDAPRVGLGLALAHRWSILRVGARVLLSDALQDETARSITIDKSRFLAALIEVGRSWDLGVCNLYVGVGAGAAVASIRYRATDVFAGSSAPERARVFDPLARATVALELPLPKGFSATLGGGLQAHASRLSVRLPEPYSAAQGPLRRSLATPFGSISLAWEGL